MIGHHTFWVIVAPGWTLQYDATIISDKTADTPPPRAPDRHARRRERTRAQLLAAAKTLFARQGVESTRINEITEEADVGFGSFYNHFASKEAIVEAVLEDATAAHGEALAGATAGLEDPAETVAVAHRYFVALTQTDPDWAWLLIRLEGSYHIAWAALGAFATHDLDRGISAGRFNVPDRDVALLAAGGALLTVMRAVLDGRARPQAGRPHAEGILRMFGVSPADAAEVARRPMPKIPR